MYIKIWGAIHLFALFVISHCQSLLHWALLVSLSFTFIVPIVRVNLMKFMYGCLHMFLGVAFIHRMVTNKIRSAYPSVCNKMFVLPLACKCLTNA